jgi:hypothetical protein
MIAHLGEQPNGTFAVQAPETAKVEKPQLHVSGLEMLSKCGEQFRRVYIERERMPPAVAMIVGTATHKSVARNLESKIKTGLLLSVAEVKDTARDSLASEWESGIRLDEDEVKEGIKKVKAGAIDKAVTLSALHLTDVAPLLIPTHVERGWVIEMPDFPFNLAGTLDIQEGSSSVRDTKTAGKTPAKTIADESLQLTAYALATKVIDGVAVKSVKLDYLIDNKTPIYTPFISTRDDDDFKNLLLRIERASKAIEKGVFIPARETDWWCSKKWCGFHGSCPFAKQPKQFAAA